MADGTRDQGRALRADAAEAIEACIARLERERRSPDFYECGWLIRAIAWFSQGQFMEATLDATRAEKPSPLRTSEDCVQLSERHQTLTTSELRRSWDDRKQ